MELTIITSVRNRWGLILILLRVVDKWEIYVHGA